MAGNDDLSMNIGNQLAEKTAIVRMEATVDELIQSTTDAMKAVKEGLPNGVGAIDIRIVRRKKTWNWR